MRTYQKLMMLAAALLTAGTVAVNAQDFIGIFIILPPAYL